MVYVTCFGCNLCCCVQILEMSNDLDTELHLETRVERIRTKGVQLRPVGTQE